MDQIDDLWHGDIELARLGKQGIDTLHQDLHPLAPVQFGTRTGDVRPRCPPLLDDPLGLQLAIRRATVLGLTTSRSARVRIGGSSSPGTSCPAAARYFTWLTI